MLDTSGPHGKVGESDSQIPDEKFCSQRPYQMLQISDSNMREKEIQGGPRLARTEFKIKTMILYLAKSEGGAD